jgi:hypothetical protein
MNILCIASLSASWMIDETCSTNLVDGKLVQNVSQSGNHLGVGSMIIRVLHCFVQSYSIKVWI